MERPKPRKSLPPLLFKLSERKPERLDYLGVSYGLTPELLRSVFIYATTPVSVVTNRWQIHLIDQGLHYMYSIQY